VVLAGAVRRCEADQSEHYPRTDGAIIVLVKDNQNRILLGRQKVWPKNRFSTFAGFVEPGESFENCLRREVMEEFTRAQMKSAIEDKTLILPLEISVARQMIKAWYGEGADTELVGNESWR